MLFLCLVLLFQSFHLACSEPFIGINIGELDDNHPPPHVTAQALESTCIEKVRLLEAEAEIMKALAKKKFSMVIGVDNSDIASLASDPQFAPDWVKEFVSPFYPITNISIITVGSEIMSRQEHHHLTQHIVPAMQNMQNALNKASLGGKIKVSTVNAMGVLADVNQPSAAKFKPEYDSTMQGLLKFLKENGSPFMINLYPYVSYQKDPKSETLEFCLFKSKSGRVDSATGLTYMNMYDSLLDGTRNALANMKYEDIEVVVSETGWPYKGDSSEVGPGLENAQSYVGNLVNHLKKMEGTPQFKGKSVDTYLFELYDENLKGGARSDRAYGIFKPDLTLTYNSGILKAKTPF
ncbi:hypothetical protein LguiB_007182 [Lonicera macranthoides]